jgi:hypothetical protein
MNISTFQNYFNVRENFSNFNSENKENRIKSRITVLSYFTLLAPLAMGIGYGCYGLKNCITKIAQESDLGGKAHKIASTVKSFFSRPTKNASTTIKVCEEIREFKPADSSDSTLGFFETDKN